MLSPGRAVKGSEEFKVIFLSVSMVGEKIFPENRFLRFLKFPNFNYQILSPSSSESYTVPYVIENVPQAADIGVALESWVSCPYPWAARVSSRYSECPLGRKVWVPGWTHKALRSQCAL